MSTDIVIVDDDTRVLGSLKTYASMRGLSPYGFASPRDAEEYLGQRGDPPLGYFVDMRIPDDLEGSERLFFHLKGRGDPLDHFYFMTGHVSEHDLGVLARTGARVLEKNGNEVFGVLEELCAAYLPK